MNDQDSAPLPYVSPTVAQYQNQLRQALREFGVPRTAWEGLEQYVMIGRPVGEFLYGVLSNDLMRALRKADYINIQCLREYGVFLDSFAPAGSYGSEVAVKEWMRTGGLLGRQAASQAAKGAPPSSSVE